MKRARTLYVLLFALFACHDDNSEEIPLDFGYDYAPLSVGQSSVFQIDSIIYDDFNNSIDTISFQRKEDIVNSFTDDAGEKAFRIELSHRTDDSSTWKLIRVFTSYRNKTSYVKTDNNQSTVLLVFPPNEGKEWDGNNLNTKSEVEFSYTAVNKAETINQKSYNSSLTVLQQDEFNRIQQFYTEEKYARGFGLIYRKDKQVETELNGDIRSGYEATLSLIEFKSGEVSK